MALAITQSQYNTLITYVDAEDYVGGWTYLASLGDNYADNAANKGQLQSTAIALSQKITK